MILNVKLENEDSCTGCPALNPGIWNEPWICALGRGTIEHKEGEVYRPRPIVCKEYSK